MGFGSLLRKLNKQEEVKKGLAVQIEIQNTEVAAPLEVSSEVSNAHLRGVIETSLNQIPQIREEKGIKPKTSKVEGAPPIA